MTRSERDVFIRFLDKIVDGAQKMLDGAKGHPEVTRRAIARLGAAKLVMDELLQEPLEPGR